MGEYTFRDYIVGSCVELHKRIHYRRVTGGYDSTIDGTFEKMKDQIKYEYLKEIIRDGSSALGWDIEELNTEVVNRIRKETSIYR